jgi:hypothetical protein
MPFFNTNAEQGAELVESRKAAKGQEDAILAYFVARPTSNRTRRDIEVIFRLPVQSATRALRNLTKAGKLEKSFATIRCESSGKSVHTWRLARARVPEQGRLF